MKLFLAIYTHTIYFHSVVFNHETCFFRNHFFHFIKTRVLKINNRITLFTDNVIMMSYICIEFTGRIAIR